MAFMEIINAAFTHRQLIIKCFIISVIVS